LLGFFLFFDVTSYSTLGIGLNFVAMHGTKQVRYVTLYYQLCSITKKLVQVFKLHHAMTENSHYRTLVFHKFKYTKFYVLDPQYSIERSRHGSREHVPSVTVPPSLGLACKIPIWFSHIVYSIYTLPLRQISYV